MNAIDRDQLNAAKILVVDDEPPYVELLERILQSLGYRNTLGVSDPAAAAEAVVEFDPDLILLDLRMPELDGIAVLQQLEAYTRRFFLPVIMLVTEASEESRNAALMAGARDFIAKPFDVSTVRSRVGNLLEARILHLQLAERNAFFERRVRERMRDVEASRLEVLERLALIAEWRLDPSGEHPRNVGKLAARIARSAGLGEEEAELLRLAAPLHDIGMIAIPEVVLCKPGQLDADEMRLIRTHTEHGEALLEGEWRVLKMAARIAGAHHEFWDGSGYPRGIVGEEIPMVARVTAVADVADALRQPRPHRAPWPDTEIRSRIIELSGIRFDPQFVDAFLALDDAGSQAAGS
ncbi:MAG: response regulator [Gemmatimonadota bacterium]|jgi:putative two-component system response regulator